ncbi:MAG TPA: hypothetical protein VG075_04460 [Candidatus Acidoferrum sp.]|jgi:hypothetical protein|nr:hypothetical protein [Candidatus Acidoferrum sp.]
MQPIDEYNLLNTLEAAQEELLKLTDDREKIERRMNQLQNDIVHLAALCRKEVEDPIKQLGLTDAIRYIFSRENRPLDKQQVAAILEKSYDVDAYKNLLANVHTIVRRLVKSGEVKLVHDDSSLAIGATIGEKEKYTWSGRILPPPPPSPNRISAAKVTNKFTIEDRK